ncbi:hypothetical protein T02_7255 [Trichinella nativa]|uniref:Uncharacterized protein n=1 Tax=Trichinella nativa TaxID=6335 RepID=A0A0V1L0H5_9BILA|nr:hypothetical protein T02_7255 [Trichinella nativa]
MIERHTVIDKTDRNERLHNSVAVHEEEEEEEEEEQKEKEEEEMVRKRCQHVSL